MNKFALLLAAALPLAGCASMPPLTQSNNLCQFRLESFIVDDPGYDEGRNRTAIPASTLVLSGGGEKGAFGAGFLKGWARANGGALPKFDLVTGISTGAILATWAFVGDVETPVREYRITNERQLLNAYARPNKDGGIGAGAAIKLIRKNSLGDLDPLRRRLREVIDRGLLELVARNPGQLKIGAVEVDTGELQMFDMGDMARRAVAAKSEAEFEHLRDCYVDAIMASSSVPVGAQPVFIDNRMYVDGGVRQGVFVDYLSKLQRQFVHDSAVAKAEARRYMANPVLQTKDANGKFYAPQMFVLMNGTQWAERQCGRLDRNDCDMDNHFMPDPINQTVQPSRIEPGSRHDRQHRDWQIAKLALRTTDILANQIYRFSARRTEEQYRMLFPQSLFHQRFYFARMHRTDLTGDETRRNAWPYTIGSVTQSCTAWRKQDQIEAHPLQFHPRYMACLEAYGEDQAGKLNWSRTDLESQVDERQTLE